MRDMIAGRDSSASPGAARGAVQPALPELDAAARQPAQDPRDAGGTSRALLTMLRAEGDGGGQVMKATMTTTTTADRGRRKMRVGKVVSDKMDKTVVVEIERLVKHPRYGRYVRRRSKFKVHDEKNECRVGDIIRFMETRPLSKEKRWRFVEFVERRESPTRSAANGRSER